jgi:transposase
MVGQKLSNLDRARALGYLQSGRSTRNVARTFNVSPTTMTNLLRRYNQTGDVKDRPRSGRPKVTTPVEDRRIRTRFLKTNNIERMNPWPACSPDMNPIENVWDQLGQALKKRLIPGSSLADVARILTEEWNGIPQAKFEPW